MRVVLLAVLPAGRLDGHDMRVLGLEDLQVVLKRLQLDGRVKERWFTSGPEPPTGRDGLLASGTKQR